MNLKNLRNKIDNIDDINLTAEKELNLEIKINDILIEEKDLNNAAKKLEKAIEELNKKLEIGLLMLLQILIIRFQNYLKSFLMEEKPTLNLQTQKTL